jgi:hypothetical protein
MLVGAFPGGDGEPDADDVVGLFIDDCGPMMVDLARGLVPEVPDVPQPGELEGIVSGIIDGLLVPPDDTPSNPYTSCGADARPDLAFYGYGRGDQAASGTGVENVVIGQAHHLNGDRPMCGSTDANQYGFARDYVNIEINEPDTGQPRDVKVGVTSGWYDVR